MNARLFYCAALSALTLGACRTAPNPRALGPVPISSGTATAFSALVPVPTGPLRCEVRERDDGQEGGRVIALVRDGSVDQRMAVTVDAEGTPVRYLDARGDLDASGDAGGDRTTIGLYLTEGYAVVGNRASGEAPSLVEIPLAEAKASPNLGLPGEQMERVLTECGRTN